jgi:CBS domain-containing protein
MTQDSLAPTIEFLRRHVPFDQMSAAHLEYMSKRLKLGFYAKGEIITGPTDGPATRFFIIKQGRTRGEMEQGEVNEDGTLELVAGECFPIGALLSRRPVRNVYRAAEDTFCFELDRADYEKLLVQSPVFHDFCTRRLANLLDNALHRVQAASAARMSENSSLNTPLRALIQREPVSCPPETPLAEVLHRMEQENVGSIVMTEAERRPVGVFTLHDVLSRVTLPGKALTTPVGQVMSPDPLALPSSALAYEAALLMAQNGFGHVCVVDRGRLVGVVSERDLFSLQRVGLVNLSRSITRAESIDTLAALGGDVHRLIGQMLAQGASVEQLTQIIAALNDSLTRRVIDLVTDEMGTPTSPFTWLSFGSEGRQEQTLKTDQDNGILFRTPNGKDPEHVREELLPLAKRINDALDRCGFPLCKGGVMAGNPKCCLSVEEWRQRFGRWIDQGTPEHLLYATIYFDLRPLYGDPSPAHELRTWLIDKVAANSRFRHQMAGNALRNRPPLGLIRDFKVSSGGDHPHTLDLKVQGLAPFVDGARLYALATRVNETNTMARLRGAVQAGALKAKDVDAWAEAYHFIQLLRMRTHRRQAEEGRELSNHIDPDTLNELDRRILKEAFRQARKLQSKLALEYQL